MLYIDVYTRRYWIAFREWLNGEDWEDAITYAKNVTKDFWG